MTQDRISHQRHIALKKPRHLPVKVTVQRRRGPLGLPRDMETDLSEEACLQLKALTVVENDLAAEFEALVPQ